MASSLSMNSETVINLYLQSASQQHILELMRVNYTNNLATVAYYFFYEASKREIC